MRAYSSDDQPLTHRFADRFDRATRTKGYAYASQGRVTLLRADEHQVDATVRGSAPYRVEIASVDGEADALCSCPHYKGGHMCKHVWAVLEIADEEGHLRDLRQAAIAHLVGPEAELADGGLDHDEFVPTPRRAGKDQRAAPRTATPSWRALLRALDHDAPTTTMPRSDDELLYLLDCREEVADAGVAVLQLASRRRKKDGTPGAPHLRSMRRDEIARVDPADRAILQALVGAEGHYSPYHALGRFALGEGLIELLLPRLAATGRLYLQGGDAPRPILWDEGAAWKLRVRLEPKAQAFALTAFFERGEDRLSLSEPDAVFTTGFVLARGFAARLGGDAGFAWIAELRRSGPISVSAGDADTFVEQLHAVPGGGAVELPDALRPVETRAAPRPRVRIAKPKSAWQVTYARPLEAHVSFTYEGQDVAASDTRDRVFVHGQKRVVLRDRAAEEEALAALLASGVRRAPRYRNAAGDAFELASSRLPRVVAALAAAGWHVEADGDVYRPPGAVRISVSSGVDWFEMAGGAQYGDEIVPLPRLLAAARRGVRFVRLGDGSVGLLPEEWLARAGIVLGAGEARGDALRFKPGQALLLDALLAAEPSASCDEAFARLRGELDSFDGVAPIEAPPGFCGELRPYQRVALGWAAFLRKFRLGGCLADDMGLGKTVTLLALLEARRAEGAPPSLVVVPRSLVWNWQAEAARFAPSLRVRVHMGVARASEAAAVAKGADLVLTTYGTLRRDAHFLKDARFDYLVLDEAQAIKNAASATAKAARLLHGDHRLALSGTPIENHLGELWSLMEFLDPGLLGGAAVFRPAIGSGGELDQATRRLLARALRPFILRRTKEQVAPELPRKTEQTITVELDADERRRYDELRAHYRRTLLGGARAWGRTKFNVLEALLRLRQAACHGGLVDATLRDGTSSKLEVLMARLREVIEEGHKALVFSQFTSLLAIVRAQLDREGVVYEYLDGKTRDRAERVERFQGDPACPLFLVSLKAGGLGLNLTAAEYVFLLDPWWNPAVEAQAVDRAHRIGQSRPVFAYRLVARDTVEEKVLELQGSKRALADAILHEDRAFLRDLTREDLALLLS
ncbi:MAG: DEAD/DEAH box helicase [Myxococcota bacterium]